MDSKALVIIPTYNEIDNIGGLIGEIGKHLKNASVLVVDDNSPDGTGDLVEKIMAENGRVHLIRRAGKMGLGTAYLAGFKYALERDFEFIFEMDADFSHDPSYLPGLLAAAQDASLALGSRYIDGGGVENWSFLRKMISRGGSLYARLILGLPYHDLTGGFKCFRREALEAIDLDAVHSEGYSFQIEMTYRVHKKGMRIVETPIIFYERAEGKSKMSNKIFFEAIYRVWQIWLTVR